MSRRVTVLFGSVFAISLLTGFGCALSNYELITDSDGRIVNTKGNAYIRQFAQVATAYPDGNDDLLWYVDQKANGDRKLSTVNYFTTVDDETPTKDELYCSPDWSGCKVATANDPEVGDIDDYDYTVNPHCSGYRSLSLAIATTRYYGECGRARNTNRAAKLVGMASTFSPVTIDGRTWLRGSLSALNSALVLNDRKGSAFSVPLTADVGITMQLASRRMILDLTNPNNRDVAQNAVDWASAHHGPVEAVITVNGNDFVFHVKPMNNATSWPSLRY